MLRRVVTSLLLGGFATAAACAYAPERRPIRLVGSDQFTLAPGEQAELGLAGRTATVRLVGVDDRPACVPDEPCRRGRASGSRVLVDIEVPGESYQSLALTVTAPEEPLLPDTAPCLPVGERRIRVTDVTPKPDYARPQGVYLVSFRATEPCYGR